MREFDKITMESVYTKPGTEYVFSTCLLLVVSPSKENGESERKAKSRPLVQGRDQVERDITVRADIGEGGSGELGVGSEQMVGEGREGISGRRDSLCSAPGP